MRRNKFWNSVAVSVVAMTASAAWAQVQQLRVGHALDANPSVGSGGSNQPVPGYVPLNGNEVISGNVSGLSYFHGRTGTTSNYQFQGNLPSSALNDFSRQSAGGVGATGLNQAYYLPSSTVSGGGGLYSAPIGGGFDSKIVPYSAISPLTSQSQLRALNPTGISIMGQAFDRTTAGMTPLQPGTPGALLSSPLFSLRLTDKTAEMTSSEDPNEKNKLDALNPLDAGKPPKKPTRDETVGVLDTGRLDPRIDGQSLEIKTSLVTPRDKPSEDLRIGDSYRTLLNDLKKAEADANGGKQPSVTSVNEPKGTNLQSDIDPLTGRPRQTTLKKPVKGTGFGTSTMPEGNDDKVIKPELPTKRLEDLSMATLTAGSRVRPIRTFVPKREDGQTTPIDVLMTRAEVSMRKGKYLEAAESYQMALASDPNNALALIGRAHAELGAGMYQSAAYDLKFVFTRNPQMVSVRYELDAFIPGNRQDFLVKDLATLANGKDMANVASFLLTYIYYQTGKKEMLQAELQKWNARQGHDSWQAVLNRSWMGDRQDSAPATAPK